MRGASSELRAGVIVIHHVSEEMARAVELTRLGDLLTVIAFGEFPAMPTLGQKFIEKDEAPADAEQGIEVMESEREVVVPDTEDPQRPIEKPTLQCG